MGSFWRREASKFWDVDSNPANRSVKFQPFFGKVEGDIKAFQDVSKKNYLGLRTHHRCKNGGCFTEASS